MDENRKPARGAERKALTAERLRELLHYDPETGVFTRIATVGKSGCGQRAGSITHTGKRRVKIDYQEYFEHSLAWLYMTGYHAHLQIDHRDCDPLNNKWANLRLATQSQNFANKRKIRTRAQCASLLKGAFWTGKRSGKQWMSSVRCNGVRYYLGSFSTDVEAHAAYCAKAAELFGEFARFE